MGLNDGSSDWSVGLIGLGVGGVDGLSVVMTGLKVGALLGELNGLGVGRLVGLVDLSDSVGVRHRTS